MKTTLYALNSNTGAYTAIPSTQASRMVQVREDESVTAQGLQYQKPDDGFVAVYNCGTPAGPDQPQIVLGDQVAFGHGRGNLLGLPQQSSPGAFNYRPADTYLKVRSRTGTATTVRVAEFD